MKIINFAHPITANQITQIQALLNESPVPVNVPTNVDRARPVAEVAKELVDAVGFTAEQWQGDRFIVNVPGLAVVAIAVLTEIHGRCGYFPPVINLRPVAGATPPVFEVAEIVNLASVRASARTRR